VDGRPFTFVDGSESDILNQLEKRANYKLPTEDVATGIDVHQDRVVAKHLELLKESKAQVGDGIFVLSSAEKKALKPTHEEEGILKPYYTTTELDRYYASPLNQYWVIYTDTTTIQDMDRFPNVRRHLDKFAPVVTSDNKPYGLHRARDERFFVGAKLISLRKTARPHFTYVDFPSYVSQTFEVIKSTDMNLKYLVALLNSKLADYWFDKRGKKQGDMLQIDKEPLLRFPIRRLDLARPEEKAQHDRIVALVEEMLALQQRRRHPAKALTAADQEELDRRIAQQDRAIDDAVYDLYGLTADERRIVEEAVPTPSPTQGGRRRG
jgi:adenine-specific DNA-methyltransferase